VSTLSEFRPPWWLAGAQLQSILASRRPHRRYWQDRGSRMEELAQEHLLDCGDGVRLLGYHSPQPQGAAAKGLAVLIHGWEGHHESTYIWSMACRLHAEGWNVFRLNLRDHGGTHALNEEMFHSARMDEVINAVKAVRRFDAAPKLVAVGFSLGGNFALRVGLQGPAAGLRPDLSIGISPSINPGATLQGIDSGPLLFRKYFRGKWLKTLAAKSQAWPGKYDFSGYLDIQGFVEITRRFAVEHAGYPSYEDYLATYTLTPRVLMDSPSPLAVITAQDDTVCPYADFAGLEARGAVLVYDAPPHGGHCGFVENLKMESWAEKRVAELLRRL
jgi:uncharacterized protein